MKILCVTGIIILIMGAASFTFAGEAKSTAVDGEWISAELDALLRENAAKETESDQQPSSSAVCDIETIDTTTSEDPQFMLTDLEVEEYTSSHSTLLELGLGNVLKKAQKLHSESEQFEVTAPTTVVGVRGGVPDLEVDDSEED
ncbi:MAG: hypothetical protein ABH875_00230 [Candidatus Omnitrophota bacterium]